MNDVSDVVLGTAADPALATAAEVFVWIAVLALAAECVGRQTLLPRITALLLVGITAGPTGLDVLPAHATTGRPSPRSSHWPWSGFSWVVSSTGEPAPAWPSQRIHAHVVVGKRDGTLWAVT